MNGLQLMGRRPACVHALGKHPSAGKRTVEVLDSRGRAMCTERITARSGFVEFDVRAWSDGLYLARVVSNGKVVGETRFTVAR